MKQELVIKNNFQSDKELTKEIIKISKKNPDSYIVFGMSLRSVYITISKRKPSSANAQTEHTYRYYGGFFKNGKIVKPSNSFVKKYNFIPAN